ncbi:MAG: bL17 family ribosomal protein [Proteobacteria bacterium]|nr:bL17 family ribosomal protein [Pseudomonadota bacterium]
MRHVKRYGKLGRNSAHRRSMLRGLATNFFIHGYIQTTVSRAKEVQPIVEKLITYAIKSHQNDLKAYRKWREYLHQSQDEFMVYHYLKNSTVAHEGGRTSIKKLGVTRMGDGAPLALLFFMTDDMKKTKEKKFSTILHEHLTLDTQTVLSAKAALARIKPAEASQDSSEPSGGSTDVKPTGDQDTKDDELAEISQESDAATQPADNGDDTKDSATVEETPITDSDHSPDSDKNTQIVTDGEQEDKKSHE